MEGPTRKRTRKGKPAPENDSAMQGNEKTLDSNLYLTYDILRIIFQYLNARDLANAAVVCRLWLEAANKEKSTRGPCCFIEVYKTQLDFLLHVNNVRVKPSIGFFFMPDSLPANVEERIEALLPEHCEAVMLYTKGIIMDNKEMEYHPFPNIVCAFLPQISNVTIKVFKLTECEYCIIRRTTEYQEILSTINNHGTSTANYKMSTCLMLFCNYMGDTTAKRWASAIRKSKKNEVASVWGGVLQDIHAKHPGNVYKKTTRQRNVLRRMDEPYCIAVLITGSIQTWSVILDQTCNTKDQVEGRLKSFKDEVKLKKHSMGFMFVCKARGSEMYDETNVESTIFKKIFPKVPLAGCFGYGEFGKNTVDELNAEKNSEEESKSKKLKWYNEFSTVFLILTYG